jgi:hypothetical protein
MMLLVKVFDQGEPFATLVAPNQPVADIMVAQLRSAWGADEDSLFEIQVEPPDKLDHTIKRMEG